MPSTVIASASYFSDKAILRIRFVSGLVYDYLKVPEKVYQELMKSGSKGIFFNQHIKNHFTFQKIH